MSALLSPRFPDLCGGRSGEDPVKPKLSDIGLLEFNRAEEAIEEGKLTMDRMLPKLRALLD